MLRTIAKSAHTFLNKEGIAMKVGGTYLTFDGNCKEAMGFYKGVFGGDFDWQSTWGEAPIKDQPDEYKHLMMHCSLPIGSFSLMGCDRHPLMHKSAHLVGNNQQVVILPESKDSADHLFAALSKGGTVDQPLEDTFWGSYHGSCNDKYGVKWMIDMRHPSKDGKAELKRAAVDLRAAANNAIAEAAKLEEFLGAEEPHAKKVKAGDKTLENA